MKDIKQRSRLGTTGFDVSPLCLGTMQLGWTIPDEADCFALLDRFYEAGGNFIDTANMYGPDQNLMSFDKGRGQVGLSETILGRWMQSRQNRDQIILATKYRARMWDGPDGEGLSRAHITRAADESLSRLQTDSIDIYLAHFPEFPPLETPPEETMETLRDLVAAGKVKTVGSSNFDGPMMDQYRTAAEAVGGPAWSSVQPRYSMVNRSEYEDTLMRHCTDHDIGCFPFSPLAGGFLTGKYRREQPVPESVRSSFVAQYLCEAGWSLLDSLEKIAMEHSASVAEVAIAWILGQPQVASAVVGANSVGQLESLLGAGSIQLSAQELTRLGGLSWDESPAEFTSW